MPSTLRPRIASAVGASELPHYRFMRRSNREQKSDGCAANVMSGHIPSVGPGLMKNTRPFQPTDIQFSADVCDPSSTLA